MDDLDTSQGDKAGDSWQEVAQTCLSEIDSALKAQVDFSRRGKKITQRYRAALDRQDSAQAGAKFNLFWSNVQTLAPATYSKRPTVQVTRRHRDSDPVARLAGQILERGLQFEIDKGLNFHRTMESVVLDRLLPGRGVAWVRYEPSFQKKSMPAPDPENPLQLVPQEIEVLADEFSPIDYVYWDDFCTSSGRVWADVTWVARQLPFTKEALKERFGETITKFGGQLSDIQVSHEPYKTDPASPTGKAYGSDLPEEQKQALVWEKWDKVRRQVIFVSKGCPFPLDIREDVTGFDEFFPTPEPLLATVTNDELLPVADFLIYQEQLRELDTLTNRISLLTSALRVIGVYDSSQKSLQDLLTSGMDNRMVPVDAWGAFADKGGLKGVTDFLPLDQVVAVLQGLHEERERIKQTVYEITGMADIIRGASVASETLGAQQIKAKFANLRLAARQSQCAEFVTGVLQLKAQIMCNHYSEQTLVAISAAEQIEEVKRHPDRLPAALKLLKDQKLRQYRIEVMSGSMVELDEVDEHQRRNEFMSTLANFFNALKNVAEIAPEMFAVAMEMLKFVIRGFHPGRAVEMAIEDAAEGIEQRLANPEPPQPDPTEVLKLQTTKELETMRQQGESERAQLDSQTKLAIANISEGAELQRTESAQRHEASMEQMKALATSLEGERERQATQASEAAQLTEQKEARNQQVAEERHTRLLEAVQAPTTKVTEALQTLQQGPQELLEAVKALLEAAQKPRRRIPKYDSKGDILHVDETILQ